MRTPVDRRASFSVLVFALSALLLCSPLASWWMGPGMPWFAVYPIWLALIVLTALLIGRRRY